MRRQGRGHQRSWWWSSRIAWQQRATPSIAPRDARPGYGWCRSTPGKRRAPHAAAAGSQAVHPCARCARGSDGWCSPGRPPPTWARPAVDRAAGWPGAAHALAQRVPQPECLNLPRRLSGQTGCTPGRCSRQSGTAQWPAFAVKLSGGDPEHAKRGHQGRELDGGRR